MFYCFNDNVFHSFNPFFAKKYGLITAVIFNFIICEIVNNLACSEDEEKWTTIDIAHFKEKLPYLEEKEITKAIKILLKTHFITKSKNHYKLNKKGASNE